MGCRHTKQRTALELQLCRNVHWSRSKFGRKLYCPRHAKQKVTICPSYLHLLAVLKRWLSSTSFLSAVQELKQGLPLVLCGFFWSGSSFDEDTMGGFLLLITTSRQYNCRAKMWQSKWLKKSSSQLSRATNKGNHHMDVQEFTLSAKEKEMKPKRMWLELHFSLAFLLPRRTDPTPIIPPRS